MLWRPAGAGGGSSRWSAAVRNPGSPAILACKQELIHGLRGCRARQTICSVTRTTVPIRPSQARSVQMRIESSGHSPGNPRLYELVEHAPKTGKSPTVWAWPELMDYLKIPGQPVAGTSAPAHEPRPDPSEDPIPVAVPDPEPPARPGSSERDRG